MLFIHILANLLYIMSHGASAIVAFRLRRETALERIRALIDLSAYSYTFMFLSLLTMFVAGIALGFAGR